MNDKDGIYIEVFAVRDGVRYNAQVISLNDVTKILTNSILNGVQEIIMPTESEDKAIAEKNEIFEVRTASWHEIVSNGVGYHKECSACGQRWMLDGREYVCKETPFCPGCGAKMDGERKEK